MGLDVTAVFIQEALSALRRNMWEITDQEREDLCDKLVDLCKVYAPNTFQSVGDQEESED